MIKSSLSFRWVLAAAGASLLLTGVTRAGISEELSKVFATIGITDDEFGNAVAVSGTTLIVGAPEHDANGADSGAAYLFDTTTGAQIAKLLPSDGAIGDEFGNSVAISGSIAIVGSFRDDDAGSSSGSAYLFDATSGVQLAKLVPGDGVASEFFGSSVAISGTTALIGTPRDIENGQFSGAAYLFDTTTGLETGKQLPNDAEPGDFFGYSVALSGTTAIIGAYGDDDNGDDAGSAYLFDTVTKSQITKLLPNDGDPDDYFGDAVAIHGSMAVVSARGDDDIDSSSGAAYLFDTTGAQVGKLIAKDASFFGSFGSSVAISETRVAVGARFDDDNGNASGAAYLFDLATQEQLAKLLASDAGLGDRLGESVVLNGTTVFVGAGEGDGNVSDTGSVYLFDANLPPLCSDVPTISLIAGGSQTLTLEGGIENADSFYFMFGSATGTSPGIDFGGGIVLPLNFDAYLNLTVNKPSLGAFGNFRGVLDSVGNAVATLNIPPTANVLLVGVELNHAFLSAEVLGIVDFASNAVPVLIVL